MATKKVKNITDQIKTYEDSCVYNKTQPLNEEELTRLGFTRKEIVGRMLESITKALNEGKEIDIHNREPRYYPYFRTNGSAAAFAFRYSYYGSTDASAASGSRFAYHESDISDYSGIQFLDLWREYIS
ncbi:hypothetical protein [Dysgonomonas sp. ZJ279]|uniref:hypothetical protein n=1 Tax=Dysgonomonas sp. ZJ279 TaxID=2709796 RepID=UPI0013EDD3EA|nr:hypothetical protein [Dysgonomonas sp. ZJ279]